MLNLIRDLLIKNVLIKNASFLFHVSSYEWKCTFLIESQI